MTNHKLQVGQKLYYVPGNSYGKPHEITITKIGRLWVSCGAHNKRIHIDTMRADGGEYASPGTAYLSEKDYRDKMELDSNWYDFVGRISRYNVPAGITMSDIDELRVKLGIPPFTPPQHGGGNGR